MGDSFIAPTSVYQMTVALREGGGINIERGNFNVGVGRGSPVPSNLNLMTKEQPLVQLMDGNVLNLDTVVDDGRDDLLKF